MVGASLAERALAERRMREVNESWEVLRDPIRRRAYDEERLAGPVRSTGPTAGGHVDGGVGGAARAGAELDLVDVAPEVGGVVGLVVRHLPWVVALVVLAVIFVASAYATSQRQPDLAPPSRPAGAGECVDVAPGPSTTIVPCDGPHELVIVTRVADPDDCPEGTEVRRLASDGRLECVREA